MARLKKVNELDEVNQRCLSWAKHSYDAGPGYPKVTLLYKAMREREGASTRGKGESEYSAADAEVDAAVSKLPPVLKMVIKCYYLEGGTNLTKARRCGMGVTDFKTRVDNALWVVWSWLQAGHCRGK